MNDRGEQHLEFEQTPCPLCGADNGMKVLTGQDNLYGVPGKFQLVRCRDCRHVYMNPRPTLETIGLCYPAGYAPHQSAEQSDAEHLQGSMGIGIGSGNNLRLAVGEPIIQSPQTRNPPSPGCQIPRRPRGVVGCLLFGGCPLWRRWRNFWR